VPRDAKLDERTRVAHVVQLEGQAAELELQVQRLRRLATQTEPDREPDSSDTSVVHRIDLVA
ncbi:MAG: hypothetical protein ABL886_03220, partial [Rhodoglobus sp.]